MRRTIILILVAVLLAPIKARTGEEKKKPLPSTGWGTLKGTVTYDGEPPPLKDLRRIIAKNNDWDFFKKSPEKDMLDPTWVVNKKNKGVANVVIWLQAPTGTAFKIHEDDKKRKDTVVLDRPFCAYRPHLLTLFPCYFERNAWHKTGQVFKLANSAPINHCPKWVGDDIDNRSRALILKPKTEKVIDFWPSNMPIHCTCTFYTWL